MTALNVAHRIDPLDLWLKRGLTEVFSVTTSVSPDLAGRLLERNVENRPIRWKGNSRCVEAYAKAIQRGEWQLNGESIIVASDDLWEIDENFARSELTDAQRADHHVRREEILIRLKRVHDGKGRPDKSAKLAVYTDQAAASLGVSKRTVERDLARGKKIASDVLAEVSGTDLDRGVVLDELATTPREDQRAKLVEIAQRRALVRPAPDPLNDPEAHEKQLSALMAAWNRAAGVVREEFLLRIDTPVFDRGAA